jgi:aminoglycoside 3-N-acetyltransferase I
MNQANAEYTRLQRGDDSKFIELVLLFNKVFDSPDATRVNSDNIGKLLNNSSFVCFAAHIGDRIVGGLTAYELEMYDREGSSMYIYDLAVSREYQRSGIGSRLVGEIMAYCKAKQIHDLFVHADAADRHAVEFYKKVGGEPAAAFQFSLPV